VGAVRVWEFVSYFLAGRFEGMEDLSLAPMAFEFNSLNLVNIDQRPRFHLLPP